ncbi:GrpE nucleotide exchange factor [Scenedesmus sp. NREL 46B-D3]|nr:GrpE nucleotide exchange factor [Scenedesmus sp. NREL 46B-D3]
MQTYAVQKFAQSLLEVADNLESAQRAVPAAVLQPGAEISTEKALGYLKALLEGVQATERVLLKNMSTKGVERIATAEGDEFDPNTQEAMTTVPAAEGKKPSTVANVWQSGYKMHDRILRAAKVIVYQE